MAPQKYLHFIITISCHLEEFELISSNGIWETAYISDFIEAAIFLIA